MIRPPARALSTTGRGDDGYLPTAFIPEVVHRFLPSAFCLLSSSVLIRIIRVRQALGAGGGFGARDLAGKRTKHGAEVRAVAKEARGAGAPVEEEGEDRLVGLLSVATRATEHQVVAPVVRGLAASRRHVVERDVLSVDPVLAIGAHGTVATE